MRHVLLNILVFIILSSCSDSNKVNKDIDSRDTVILENENMHLLHETSFIKLHLPNHAFSDNDLEYHVSLLNDYLNVLAPDTFQLDIFKLAGDFAEKITNDINAGVSYDLDKYFELNLEVKNKFSVYSFSHRTESAPGILNYPFLVSKTGSKSKAFNLSKIIRCQFKFAFQLNENLYLMLGEGKANAHEESKIAYVIDLKNSVINGEYPAFSKRPLLNYYNGEFTYNTKTKTLNYSSSAIFNDLNYDFYSEAKYGHFAKDSSSAKELSK